jgi:amidase
MTWEETAKAEKARLEASIPAEWRVKVPEDNDSSMTLARDSGLLSEEELQITESSAADLVKNLAAGKLTSVAVTTAFCKRAALAHQAVRDFPRHRF